MDTFISTFLEKQKQELASRLDKPQAICDLRFFKYSKISYSNPLHKNLYFLRFASAYIIEYYMAYKYILDTKKLTSTKNRSLVCQNVQKLLISGQRNMQGIFLQKFIL